MPKIKASWEICDSDGEARLSEEVSLSDRLFGDPKLRLEFFTEIDPADYVGLDQPEIEGLITAQVELAFSQRLQVRFSAKEAASKVSEALSRTKKP